MNSSVSSDVIDGHDTANLVESIIKLEWNQFQQTNNEGGRASCQGNWPMFHQMRASQFMTWPEELLRSYRSDLQEADRVGRNLVTEKYGRMMQSTYPQEYCVNISCSLARRADAHTTGAGRPRRARACTARRGTGRTAAGQTGDRAPLVPARPGKAGKEARKAACPATSASCDSPVWQTCFAAGFMRRRRGASVGRIVRFATHW